MHSPSVAAVGFPLLLLLLHAVPLSFGASSVKSSKSATTPRNKGLAPPATVLFNFSGLIIGQSIEHIKAYSVTVECNACYPPVLKTFTKTNGKFALNLTPRVTNGGTIVDMLTVTAASVDNLGGQKRQNRWEIQRPSSERRYAFFMGEFEPNRKHLLFLRAFFTSELPELGENMAYLLRLTNRDGSKIYGSTEITNERRTKWTNDEEGIRLKLNRDGLQFVQQNVRTTMVLRLFKINATECAICQYVFKKGEATKRLHNCEHFYHESCVNKSFTQTNKNRLNRFKCPICEKDIALIKRWHQHQQGEAEAAADNNEQEKGMDKGKCVIDEVEDNAEYVGNASKRGGAEVVTRGLDAEGNVIERHQEDITEEQLNQVLRQSHITNQEGMEEADVLVYFKESNVPLTQIFTVELFQPVLQNGSGRPKFVYQLAYHHDKTETKWVTKLFNQSVKIVDNLDTLMDPAGGDLVSEFEEGSPDDDTTDEQSPTRDNSSEDDFDLNAVQPISDIDEYIRRGPPIGDQQRQLGQRRSGNAGQQLDGMDVLRTEEGQRIMAQQAHIFEQIQRDRMSTANRSYASSLNSSPARSLRDFSDTDPEMMDTMRGMLKQQSAIAQQSMMNGPEISRRQSQNSGEEGGDNGKNDGENVAKTDGDDIPLWELLAQSTRSRTDEHGDPKSSPKLATPTSSGQRRRPSTAKAAEIPRPNHHYERRRAAAESSTNIVGNEATTSRVPIRRHNSGRVEHETEQRNRRVTGDVEQPQQQQQDNEVGLGRALYNLFLELKQIYTGGAGDGSAGQAGQPSSSSPSTHAAAAASGDVTKKKFEFSLQILPNLADPNARYNVDVQCSWQKFDGISVKVAGNVAKVWYANDHPLVYFNITVWKTMEVGTNNAADDNLAPFLEEGVQIDNGQRHTFYMGTHFTLYIHDASRIVQIPGTQMHLTRAVDPLNYVVQVNCHGERSPGYQSDANGTANAQFEVFLPGKHCTKVDIYVGKIHQNEPKKLLEKAIEKGVTIKIGATYTFKKAFVALTKNGGDNGKSVPNNQTMGGPQNSEEGCSYYSHGGEEMLGDYVDDPHVELALLESWKAQLKGQQDSKQQQKGLAMDEDQRLRQKLKGVRPGGIASQHYHQRTTIGIGGSTTHSSGISNSPRKVVPPAAADTDNDGTETGEEAKPKGNSSIKREAKEKDKLLKTIDKLRAEVKNRNRATYEKRTKLHEMKLRETYGDDFEEDSEEEIKTEGEEMRIKKERALRRKNQQRKGTPTAKTPTAEAQEYEMGKKGSSSKMKVSNEDGFETATEEMEQSDDNEGERRGKSGQREMGGGKGRGEEDDLTQQKRMLKEKLVKMVGTDMERLHKILGKVENEQTTPSSSSDAKKFSSPSITELKAMMKRVAQKKS